MATVYRHVRKDKNEPFYIGIATDKYRPYRRHGRNKIWKDIVSKTEYVVEILFDDITRDFACEKEKEFISLYGRINNKTGILSNLTDGGDGTLGYKITEKQRQKMILTHKGMFGLNHSEETKEKIRSSNTGKVFTEERKNNISKAKKGKGNSKLKGIPKTEEHKAKIRLANLGKKQSQETINKKVETMRLKRKEKQLL